MRKKEALVERSSTTPLLCSALVLRSCAPLLCYALVLRSARKKKRLKSLPYKKKKNKSFRRWTASSKLIERGGERSTIKW